jgi:hypothetical protein
MCGGQYRGAMPDEPTESEPPRRPQPEPYDGNERPVVIAGIVAWIVAFVVLVVFFRSDLRRNHDEFWLWSCGIGVVLGLYGLRFLSRRRR